MEKKVLLGATYNNELVFGNFEIRTWNGYPQFSASFDAVMPFSVDDLDLTEVAENWLSGLDKEFLYDLCERYDCAPSDLAESIANDQDYNDLMDCSLYQEEIEVDDETWAFESMGCGQHDTRDEMNLYVNEKIYHELIDMWDNYHLKQVDGEFALRLCDLLSQLEDEDEEEWIANFIREEF